jgi:lysophospholipase L1-like esterase
MKNSQSVNSISHRIYSKFLWALMCLTMFTPSIYSQSLTTKTFVADTTSVLRNPCTGWAIYCEGWEFENTWRSIYPQVNAVNFWKQMDSISAHKYATHIYIRILWSALEPEEGKYAWKFNKEYIQFIEEAKKRNLKLSFRVYCSTKSRTEEGTPKYVFDAGAGYRWDSGIRNGKEYRVRDAFMDDPVFLEKFETFIKAFAKEYDNPDVTDFVDGFGAGWWGEGHHNNLKDINNLPMLIDKLTGFYYNNFKNVITVYNLAHKHPDPTIVSDFELAKELVYEQRGFIPRRDGLGSHWFSQGDRDRLQYYFFPNNIPLIGEGCYWLSNPVADTDTKFTLDTRFDMKTWPEALKKGLDDALNFHANTFDLRVPKEAKLWIEEMPDQVQRFITHGGYRFVPESINFSNEVVAGGKIRVTHTWKNTGVGLLPNNHPNWNQKYKVAFALFEPKSKQQVSKTILEQPNPGTWKRGRYYTYQNQVDVGKGKDSLLLAVSIFDTKKGEPGLELSVKDESFNKWYPVGMVAVKNDAKIETAENNVLEAKNLETNSDGATITFDPAVPEELRMRGGLPNFFDKLKTKDTVRIAYVGGSITEANGWRINSLNWLKSQYPKVQFVEINAAISGTGSDFAACRIIPDVMAKKPDLVFLEHRVNGGGGFEKQSVEGVIRQIWKQNPLTEICFIHTVSLGMIPAIQSGKTPAFGAVIESLANQYNIPSIDFGVEVARLEMAAELAMKSDLPVAGKLWFSMDGVHPGEAGHELYAEIFARSFNQMKNYAGVKEHRLSVASNENNWEKTTLLPITKAKLSAGWKPVNTQNDTIYQEDFKRTDGMLRGAVKCSKVGESVSIKWNGTTIGFSDIPYGSGCKIQVVIDNGKPVTIERKQTEKQKYARFFYLPEQAPEEHSAILTITELPAGVEYYLGQILVVGSVLK